MRIGAGTPPAMRDAEAINERVIRTRLAPLLEKYGFDFKRVEAEATRSEKAFADHPSPEFAKVQEARNLYQNKVCGSGGSPPAADVTFKADSSARPYCTAVAAQRKGLERAELDPAAVREYVTSDSFSQALDKQDATAPSAIAADVKADNDWVRTRKLEVLEKFDYDLRRIRLEGSAEDLAVDAYWHPAIVKQDSRVEAYQEQVCGIGP